MRRLIATAACLLVAAPAAAEPDWAPAVRADYTASLGSMWDWFRRNPELSFKETKTAARMATELKAVPGMVVTEGVGGTGVVGVLKNGTGPTILLRADMDGLPVEARNGGPAIPSHHSPLFRIEPEPAIVTGTIAMTAAALDLLGPAKAN
jgi:hippurate hydrolase